MRAAGKHVPPVVFRSIGEELHFVCGPGPIIGRGKVITATGLAGRSIVEIVGSFVFIPGTGVGVGGDTETVVHIVIFYGNGTGKHGRVRTAIRRGGFDAVGVKRIQVKRGAAAL